MKVMKVSCRNPQPTAHSSNATPLATLAPSGPLLILIEWACAWFNHLDKVLWHTNGNSFKGVRARGLGVVLWQQRGCVCVCVYMGALLNCHINWAVILCRLRLTNFCYRKSLACAQHIENTHTHTYTAGKSITFSPDREGTIDNKYPVPSTWVYLRYWGSAHTHYGNGSHSASLNLCPKRTLRLQKVFVLQIINENFSFFLFFSGFLPFSLSLANDTVSIFGSQLRYS